MLTFFTDRDLGKRFPAILRKAGLNVELLDDHFRSDTPDPEWLEVVGALGRPHVRRDVGAVDDLPAVAFEPGEGGVFDDRL